MSLFSMPAKDGTEPLDAIYGGGDWRILGSKPTPPGLRAGFPPYGDSKNPVIPKSQWKPVARRRADVPILDQDGRGSCVGHGAASAMMLARSIADLGYELLSAPFVYALCNGGLDNGAYPGDAAKVVLAQGICLMSEFPEPQYLATRIPPSAYQTALRFRAIEIYRCMNFVEAVSAFLCGFSVFDTVNVGPQFNALSADGVPPVSSGPGNHCTAFGDSLKQTKAGVWVSERRNSWGPAWGVDGYYFQGEEHCARQGSTYEAWAIKDVHDDPEGPHQPPPLPPGGAA